MRTHFRLSEDISRGAGSLFVFSLILALMGSCVKPREREGTNPISRLNAPQIVVGRVESVQSSRLSAVAFGAGVKRESVCLDVYHVIVGQPLQYLCFIQFTTDAGGVKSSVPNNLEEGIDLVVFLEQEHGHWRPSIDYERVWIELLCADSCRDRLIGSTARGKLAEVILRRAESEKYPSADMNLWKLVQSARVVSNEPFIRDAVSRLASSGSDNERRAACKFLREYYHEEACTLSP